MYFVFLAFCTMVSAQAKRVITNLDLEKYREQRVKAEQEYLEKHKEKGLPSPEDIEKIAQERRKWLAEFSQRYEQQILQTAEDFQRRADELRLQIASIEAQISYVRRQINEFDGPYRGGAVSSGIFTGTFFFPTSPQGTVIGQSPKTPPNVQTVQNFGLGFPTATEIRNRVNGVFSPVPQAIIQTPAPQGTGFFFYPFPVIVDNTNYARRRLVERLQELEQLRAGLLATLSALEEQARRAGVKIR
ncbi:MAG: hypothetical protein D6687_05960 [Acidobacteria bacterium]|nr:MAG: hypothetical protein D6687_05960 [Acidobacteriota bacterium]